MAHNNTNKTIIAFDLYGTLLATDSIAESLSTIFGHDAAAPLAAQWRRYQLEYTWRINSMGVYRPFDQITLGALHHAVAEAGLPGLSASDSAHLMSAYNRLAVFSEVPAALGRIQHDLADSFSAYIFSNGTDEMVRGSIAASAELAPFFSAGGVFAGQVVTVDGDKRFKPDGRTYANLLGEVGREGSRSGEVWLVTANPFDVVGASYAGLKTAWVDRAGSGWVDRLGDVIGGGVRPGVVVGGVDGAVEAIVGAVAASQP
ncbi:HAD-like domain-containing protein [Bombardia bombarda]|uniref:HAD-like domain-containing protein n=1 Tax=Bombardia bombarda TaxID=252184 RepID=A0AA39X145_9PEZI|nr:HAD-like domain-containing protein [Bombardia bombarda]